MKKEVEIAKRATRRCFEGWGGATRLLAIACDDEQDGGEWWYLGRRGFVFSSQRVRHFIGFLLVAGE
jgi:hypothetical protein